jgi:hypothetical protein
LSIHFFLFSLSVSYVKEKAEREKTFLLLSLFTTPESATNAKKKKEKKKKKQGEREKKMTDDLWYETNQNTKPVSTVQTIVYNAMVDPNWERRSQNQTPKYGGPADRQHVIILKGEPTVYEKSQAPLLLTENRNMEQSSHLKVFTLLNLWGKRNWTKKEALDKLRWGGFKSYGNPRTNAELMIHIDFPCYHAGLTTVLNNGDKSIIHGDLVMWDIPEDESEARDILRSYQVEGMLTGVRGNRRTVFIRPYNPSEHGVQRRLIKDVLDKPYREYSAVLAGKSGYVDQANAVFVEAVSHWIAIGAIMERAGIFTTQISPTATKYKDATRVRNAIATAMMDSGTIDIYQLLGIGTRDSSYGELGHVLKQGVFKVAAPSAWDDFIIKGDPPSRMRTAVQSIQKGSMELSMGNIVETTIHAVIDGEHHDKKRVIGRAMTSAAPGRPFDIICIP